MASDNCLNRLRRLMPTVELGCLAGKTYLTEPHLEDIACRIQMSCIYEIFKTLGIENV